MDNNIYLKYLKGYERNKLKSLEIKISQATSVNEIKIYKQEIAEIMTRLIRRYRREYYTQRRSRVSRNGKVVSGHAANGNDVEKVNN